MAGTVEVTFVKEKKKTPSLSWASYFLMCRQSLSSSVCFVSARTLDSRIQVMHINITLVRTETTRILSQEKERF